MEFSWIFEIANIEFFSSVSLDLHSENISKQLKNRINRLLVKGKLSINWDWEITSLLDVFTMLTMTNNQSYSEWLSIIHIPQPPLSRFPPGNPLDHWTSHSDARHFIIIDVMRPSKIIEQANIKQRNLKGVNNLVIEIILFPTPRSK